MDTRSTPTSRSARRATLTAAAALLLAAASCVHLLQPQTYYLATDRVEQQRQEYLAKELMADLPEDLFRRWYTKDASWADDLRPYILEVEADDRDGRTVYAVGSGGRTIAEVVFRGGRLEEVGGWHLDQSSLLSAWFHESGRPRETATPEMLERLRSLDPASEPFRPEERPDRGAICRLEQGTILETMQAMRIRRFGRRRPAEISRPLPAEPPLPAGPDVLPPMTRLLVKRWGKAGTARLVDERDGREYALRTWEGDLCPAGECPALGAPAVLTRDLVVATGRDWTGQPAAIAVVPAQIRIPVWMERPGVLRAGMPVRVVSWDPCGAMIAEIEIPGGGDAGLPAAVKVPVAPPGLFARPGGPARAPSGGPGAVAGGALAAGGF
jgi:hypothetical protein